MMPQSKKLSQPEEFPMEARPLLRELAARWRAASTLEYRSEAVVDHRGEYRIVVKSRVRLRRPAFARLVFLGDRPGEASRVRVCDGRRVFDRRIGSGHATTVSGFTGRLIADIAHPLDEAAYAIDQFFAPSPFLPPAAWGDPGERLRIAAARLTSAAKSGGAGGRGGRFRITFTRGDARDTLILDARSYAPQELVRVGPHAGIVQELLRETFSEVRLGLPLPLSLFTWTPEDEAGILRRS